VVGAEMPRECLFEPGDLRAHPPLGHLGEDRWVPLTCDERFDDCS
jgi:hypothetical protein